MAELNVADKETLDIINTKVDNINTSTETLESKLDTIDTVVDNIYSKVDAEISTIDTVVDSINTKVDTIDGIVDTINTNAAKLTDARMTKIDNIGATGDTGGSATTGSLFGKLNKIISDIATFVGNWTSTRAGYIDTIKTNTDRLTAARATIIDNIGATGNTGGTTSAGTVMAKLNALITNTTANNTASTTGTLSQKISSAIANTATNNTASKTGILSAKLAYVISLLENTTYGLSAIKTALGSAGGTTVSVQRGTITFGSSAQASATATISSVNTAKSFVVYGGVRSSYSVYDYSGYWDATVELTNSTTVTAKRYSNSYTSYVTYQVVTFS